MRTHYLTLGGLVLAVICAAALGVSHGGDGPVRVEESNGIKILVDPMHSDFGTKLGMGVAGILAIENGCVVLKAVRGDVYRALVWPELSRIVSHKAWPSVDSPFGDFPLEDNFYEGGGYVLSPRRLPAEVVAACPSDEYLFLNEFGPGES